MLQRWNKSLYTGKHQNKHHFICLNNVTMPEHCVKSWRKAAEIQVMWAWSLKENKREESMILHWSDPLQSTCRLVLIFSVASTSSWQVFLCFSQCFTWHSLKRHTAFTASVGWSQIRCNLPSPVTSYLWQYHSPWHREHRLEAVLPQKPHFGFSGSKLSITSRL